MGTILGAIIVIALMAIVTSMTGDPDDTLWVLLGFPIAVPIGYAILVTLLRSLRGPRRR